MSIKFNLTQLNSVPMNEPHLARLLEMNKFNPFLLCIWLLADTQSDQSTCPILSEDFGMFLTSRGERSLELSWRGKEPVDHGHDVLLDLLAILVYRPGDIKSPENSSDNHILAISFPVETEYYWLLGDVNTGTTPTTSSISKMIPFIWICDGHIVCGWEFMVEIPLWDEVVWIWITSLIVMDSPPIEHNHRAFGNEIAFIPVILDESMVHAEFVNWTPAEKFWTSGFHLQYIPLMDARR